MGLEKLNFADEKVAVRILLLLLEGVMNITTLRDEVKDYNMNLVKRAEDYLEDLELLLEKSDLKCAREVSLTEKGKKAAAVLTELKKMIEAENNLS